MLFSLRPRWSNYTLLTTDPLCLALPTRFTVLCSTHDKDVLSEDVEEEYHGTGRMLAKYKGNVTPQFPSDAPASDDKGWWSTHRLSIIYLCWLTCESVYLGHSKGYIKAWELIYFLHTIDPPEFCNVTFSTILVITVGHLCWFWPIWPETR